MPKTTSAHEHSLHDPALCELLPIRDFLDGVMVRTDGSYVAAYRIAGALTYFADDNGRNETKELLESLLRTVPEDSMRLQFRYEVVEGLNGLLAKYEEHRRTERPEAVDLAKSWATQLSSNFTQGGYSNWWNIINDGAAAIVNSLEIAISYIIFPIAIQIFTLIYTFWGAVVFAMGPLVLAVAPSQSVNSTAKFYAVNLVMWNCWTIIYAVFACLITAVHGNDLNAMMNGGPFFNGGMIPGSQPIAMIGLTSILYSICILLIPLIAGFILKAEFRGVGGSLLGLALSTMQVTRFAGAMGAGAGGVAGGGFPAAGFPGQGGATMAGGQGEWTTRHYSQPSQPPRATPDISESTARTSLRMSEREV